MEYPTDTYIGYGHTQNAKCTGYAGQQTRISTDVYASPVNSSYYNCWPTFTTYQQNSIPGEFDTYMAGLPNITWSRSSWQQQTPSKTTLDGCDAYFRCCAAPVRTDSWHPGLMDEPSRTAEVTYRDFILPCADFRQVDVVTTEPDCTTGFYQENIPSPWAEVDKPEVADSCPRADIFKRFLTSVLGQTPSKTTLRKPTTEGGKVVDDNSRESCDVSRTRRKRTRAKDDLPLDTQTPGVKRAKTSEQAVVCPVCWKVFTRRAGLAVHSRIHTGVRPYSCTDCGRSFSDYSVYVRHRRIHTRERPYACPECGDRFTQSGNLLRHRRKQHMLGPVPLTRANEPAPMSCFYDTLVEL